MRSLRTRRVWLCMLLVVTLCWMLLYIRHHRYIKTTDNTRAYPRKFVFPACPPIGSTNVNLTETLKKTLEIGNGPPPGRDTLCSMSFEDLEMYHHTYFSTIQSPCKRSVRMGNTMDGGWDVCSDEIKKHACLVYSFGIHFDFSFDDEMASVFGCEVHSFDPSMHQKDHVRNPSVFFHATGLSDYNGISNETVGWKMSTLKGIREELRHVSRAPDVIKMDIEAFEWDVLPDMLRTSQLTDVKQLLVELHANYDSPLREYWVHKLLIFRDLYLEGYRVFWTGRNMQCTYKSPVHNRRLYGCYEVSFVKVNKSKSHK
ncbi:methyltransferase-like protein 24 isoform X2 [Mizuhopecten yessoensis]|nr:methyltransferase-like protein 24 isoform X2 [Mizuhopecten yessoensis]